MTGCEKSGQFSKSLDSKKVAARPLSGQEVTRLIKRAGLRPACAAICPKANGKGVAFGASRALPPWPKSMSHMSTSSSAALRNDSQVSNPRDLFGVT
ncbi:hypothetical protein MPLDJ20_130088 [Mesorhizobium plurifarium]|uniref:Uncharacterized protein n=1 Tax=Mesorhizobium plurifarium TaxID=69974 RepID=A0A090EIP9_MESPL|nr:hypothetical protein MPLDJ20_130088 [Mesorhizobium plurifarium]